MTRRHAYIYLLLILYLFSSGCAAVLVGAGAAAGTAGVFWYQGKVEEIVMAPLPRVHRAVKAGLKEMKINIAEERADDLAAKIRAVSPDGRKVSINAKYITSSSTQLTIRVGTFGDKTFSLDILNTVNRHL